MSFWADCVKFVRSEIFRNEVVKGHTPFRFERVEVVVPANERFATYDLDFGPAYCIVSISYSGDTIRPVDVVAFFSYESNSIYVWRTGQLSAHSKKYQVDIMYI